MVLSAGVLATVALGAAQPADAATDAEWNRLASCESSGRWSINTGNGYYGGLQFSLSSWRWVNGTQFAAYPHQATRAQQVIAAERLLDRQHVSNAWPACSRRLGLTQAQMQSGTPGRGGGGGGNGGGGGGTDQPPTTGRTYTVRSGDTLGRIASRLGVSGGWHALYTANRDRIPNPNVIRVGQVLRVPGGNGGGGTSEPPNPPGGGGDDGTSSRRTYRVRAGDTLSSIASRLGVNGGWAALYNANRGRVANPNVIRVGQVLRIP